MNDVYVLLNEDVDGEQDPEVIGIFTTPEKALAVLNERGMRYHNIYAVPLDTVDRHEVFRNENKCKLRACVFKLMVKPERSNSKESVIFNRCARIDVLQAILNGGAILERNTADEIHARKYRENFPADFYYAVPLMWEFGEMEYGPENPDPRPKPVPLFPPAPGLSELVTGKDLSKWL